MEGKGNFLGSFNVLNIWKIHITINSVSGLDISISYNCNKNILVSTTWRLHEPANGSVKALGHFVIFL